MCYDQAMIPSGFLFGGVSARAAKKRGSNPPADSSRWGGVAPSGFKGCVGCADVVCYRLMAMTWSGVVGLAGTSMVSSLFL